MFARILMVASALLCPAATAAGQTFSSPWFVRVEGGLAKLHSIDTWDPAGALRAGRYLDRSRVAAVTLGVGGSNADAGYGTLALGVELQLPGNPRITPTLGGRGGLILEESYVGYSLEGGAGLAFRIGAGKWLRLGAQLGDHDEARGPHSVFIGYQAPL